MLTGIDAKFMVIIQQRYKKGRLVSAVRKYGIIFLWI